MRLQRLFILLAFSVTACAPTAKPLPPPTSAHELPVEALSAPPNPSPTPTIPALTLSSIFGPQKPGLSRFDPSALRVLVATGDVIPAREVNYKMLSRGDFLYPWRKTADYLKSGDLVFINLESPLIQNCPVEHSGFTFCGDARAVDGLDYAGVSVANLANNHLTNYGPQGTSATIALLAKHHIGVCGIGLSEIRDVKGVKFAFLGFNGIGTHIDREALRREIRLIRDRADVVVVAFHWGKEYELMPTSATGIAPDDPREIGHVAIDEGADLIIGNHPHWVQPVEIYKGRLITYAHGNFIFDQMWSRETRQGVVGRYTFYGTQLIRVDYRPVLIDDYAQPAFLDESQGEGLEILERMRHASERLAGETGSSAQEASPPAPTRYPGRYGARD